MFLNLLYSLCQYCFRICLALSHYLKQYADSGWRHKKSVIRLQLVKKITLNLNYKMYEIQHEAEQTWSLEKDAAFPLRCHMSICAYCYTVWDITNEIANKTWTTLNGKLKHSIYNSIWDLFYPCLLEWPNMATLASILQNVLHVKACFGWFGPFYLPNDLEAQGLSINTIFKVSWRVP